MYRVLVVALATAFCGQAARAANPGDIDFTLRLTGGARPYHMGESIEFEYSYASKSDRKYLTSRSSLDPHFSSFIFSLAPAQAVLDLKALTQCYGFAGSILSGGPEYLRLEPVTQQGDLSRWYRLRRAGHYVLTATSREVWRPKSADEGGGQEFLALESNAVEFDILPPDPSWEASELGDITRDLETTTDPFKQSSDQYRLGLLDTPASARKIVELYLSSPDAEKNAYASSLAQSAQIDLIVPLLEAALTNPELNPSGVPELLAELQVRKQLGVPRAFSGNPEEQKEFETGCAERRKLQREFAEHANTLVLKRIVQGSGSQQNSALYEAWQNAESKYSHGDPDLGSLTKLRLAVLDIAENLEPGQQTQFLISEWKFLPHEQLLPLIREMVPTHSTTALRLWCEDWPGDCSAGILSDALTPDTQVIANEVLFMPEAEHPEIDSALQQQLKDPAMLRESVQSLRTAALVLRAGSQNLRALVDGVLNESAVKPSWNCQVEAYLLAYLFRLPTGNAQSHLSKILLDDNCGPQMFGILNAVRYSDDLIPAAITALDSSNPAVAGTAALLLGDHGSAQVKDILWHRLDAFWNVWRNKASDLGVVLPGPGLQRQNAELEQSLASALANANNWKLTPSEQDRLRHGCLTEQCKSIADGKMSLHF